MRNVFAAIVACLLVGCTNLPERPASACSTPYQCEIEAYQKAR